MPAPTAFPTSATLYRPFEQELVPTYAVTASRPFADGGQDFNLNADQKIRRWRLRWDCLDESEAAVLDAHMDSAKYSEEAGSAYGFNFTTRSGEVLSNVRYAPGGYQRSHEKVWIQVREVLLVKYP